MNANKFSGRQLKNIVRDCLQQSDFEKGLTIISRLPPRQVVNPLFSAFCSLNDTVKWRAIMAMGSIVSNLAETDIESARVIMRRFIWNLNAESGGIGWGCPESMAEAMAQNERLAEEYWCILISYIQPEGNYLEHEVLQRGVLWGVGRLAHARPQYTRTIGGYLVPYMETDDPILRGLAAWAAGPVGGAESISQLKQLADDPSELMLYRNGKFDPYSVGQLAREALSSVQVSGVRCQDSAITDT